MKKSLVLFAAALFGFGCISCDDGQSVKEFCDQAVQCANSRYSSSIECQNIVNKEINAAPDCSDFISDYYNCVANEDCGYLEAGKTCSHAKVDECKADHNYQ